jgi:hypothetical protein
MTKIGSSGSHPSNPSAEDQDWQGQSGFRGRDPFEGRKDGLGSRTGNRDAGLRDGTGSGSRSGHALVHDSRSTSFQQRFREALNDRGERDAEREPERRRERVLAVAEAAPAEPQMAPWVIAQVPGQELVAGQLQSTPGAGTSGVEDRVAKLSAWVEQALRAELSTSAGQPLTIRIPLQDAADGLQNLTVAVTAASIEVTLERRAGEASADLDRAAQVLAERLQRRFAKGTVRVLEVVGEAAEAAAGTRADRFGDGMTDFSAIFRPRGS